MLNFNILEIDENIQKFYKTEYAKKEEYLQKIKQLQETKNGVSDPQLQSKLSKFILELEDKLEECNTKSKLNFYLFETTELIEEYKKLLRVPVKVSFMAPKKAQAPSNVKMESLKVRFLDIAKKYYSIYFKSNDLESINCLNCGSFSKFDTVDDIYLVCNECGYQQDKKMSVISYCDIDRVNIITKFSYDRRIHFRECINCYQGIQNCTIDPKIYVELEQELQKHNLLVGDVSTPRDIRFSKVSKKHIQTFLRELNYSKHYENVILIHSKLTGKKPDDISYLVEKLMNDFDIILETYDTIIKGSIDRKSFINSQCILYQLLMKYKHPCNKEDFNILKTNERQTFHNEISFKIFSYNNWPFVMI